MSLRAPLFYLIPEHTVEVAQAAFPTGNPYMRMRDELGPLYTNPEFAHLFPPDGQPAEAPATWHWSALCNSRKASLMHRRLMRYGHVLIGSTPSRSN